jgi:hypothetical protein
MAEVEERVGKPDPLYPTMDLLVQLGKLLAPAHYHAGLRRRADQLQASGARGFSAEAKMMRVLQDGIDFGKWS